MLGVIRMKRPRVEFKMVRSIYDAFERYRATLNPQPTRSFMISEACAEYLRKRGVTVPLDHEDPDDTDC